MKKTPFELIYFSNIEVIYFIQMVLTVADIVDGIARFSIEIPKNLEVLVAKFTYKGLKATARIEKSSMSGRDFDELIIKLKTEK